MNRPHNAAWKLEHVSWLCLVAAVFLMPTVTSNLSALRFAIPALASPLTLDQAALPTLTIMLAALDIGLICWALSVSLEGRPVRWHGAWATMLLFLTLAGVSWLFSVDVSTSLFGSADRRVGFLTFFLYAGCGWLTLQMADSSARLRALAVAACSAGAIQAGYGVLQTLGLDPQDWGLITWGAHRAFGTLGNPDTFGNYLALVLPLGVMLALTARTTRSRAAWWGVATLIGTGVVLSFSRGAWLGAAVGLVVLAVALRRIGVTLEHIDRVAIGTGLLSVAAVVAVTATGLTPFSVIERVIAAFQPSQGSFESRIFIWRAALDAIRERPLTGYGPDAFIYAWYQHRPLADVLRYGIESGVSADDAHSYPLQLAATLGIPATLAFFVGFAQAVRSVTPVALAPGQPSRLKLAAWLAAAAGYSVALLVSITSIPATCLLWISLAILMSPTARTVAVPKSAERAATFALTVVLAVITVLFSRVVYANHLAARSAGSSDFAQAIALQERAIAVAPWNHNYKLDLADQRLERIEPALELLTSTAAAHDDNLRAGVLDALTEAERNYEIATAEVPSDYWAATGLVNTAVVRGDLGESGAYEHAIELADRFIPTFPTDPQLQLWAAYSAYQSGDIEDARRRFEAVRRDFKQLPEVVEFGQLLESSSP